MTQATARAALRSQASTVVIEAPAGCGKTHEAASLALDLHSRLDPHQEILILAHTNAAVQEFGERVRTAKVRARALTFDSFAFELAYIYCEPLGLPSPLRVDEESGVTFADLAPKALELLQRAPSVTRALARHYPFVLLDEHQDARVEQDRIARELAVNGSKLLRIFGDPMQAIFEEGSTVNWEGLRRAADVADELDEPWRWDGARELGEWILVARRSLHDSQPLPLRVRPASVRVITVPGLTEPPPRSDAIRPAILPPLHRLLGDLSGSLAVLVRYNKHAKGLRVATKGRLTVNEGVELPVAYAAIEQAEAAVGRPRALAQAALALLAQTCTGLKPKLKAIERCLTPSACVLPKRGGLASFIGAFAPLYDSPDVMTWCKVIRAIAAAPPSWVSVQLPESLRVLGRLQVVPGEPAVLALDRAVRHRKEIGLVPYRCVSTVHKVKGRAFDHVIIPYCGRLSFPADVLGRRLLYVALSRARRTITLLVPGEGASPLLGNW